MSIEIVRSVDGSTALSQEDKCGKQKNKKANSLQKALLLVNIAIKIGAHNMGGEPTSPYVTKGLSSKLATDGRFSGSRVKQASQNSAASGGKSEGMEGTIASERPSSAMN
jgi:hypothetical protein